MDKIIDSKKIIQNEKDGTNIVDLLNRTYAQGMDTKPFERFGYVTSQFEMRSDLFATVYGNSIEDEWDILKYNGISNPFSIKEGDIFAIPQFTTLSEDYYTEERRVQENPNKSNSKQKIREQIKELINFGDRANIDSNTFENFKKKYENLKDLKKRQAMDSLRDEVNDGSSGSLVGNENAGLPPNFDTAGRNEFEINDNGEVTFAPGVANNGDDCERKTFTKAELINSLLKNRKTLR